MRIAQRTGRLLIIAIGALFAMLLSAVVTAPAEATHNPNNSYHRVTASTPCPNWSIQDMLADPHGDWDRDRVTNADEIYVAGGLNPCVKDGEKFCGLQPNECLRPYPTYTRHYHPCHNGRWTWKQINANPHGDWDGDGVSNHREATQGARPCAAPCPTAYYIDVALNPWGDWDGDGRSNTSEVHAGTNPCVNERVQVTPRPTPRPLPHVGGPSSTSTTTTTTTTTTTVTTTTVTTTAPTNPCPPGYPYYHPPNGLCYANPVGNSR